MPRRVNPQGIYWLLTIPQPNFLPYLPPTASWIKGQLEIGDGGFIHWQILVAFKKKIRLGGVRETFGPYHAELTRSEAADAYVHKEDTAVLGTRFELGAKAIRRNNSTDWKIVKEKAKAGLFEDIPEDIFVRHYSSLVRIRKDYMQRPDDVQDVCGVWIWGAPGVGKSRKARADFPDFYDKQCNKWWDGYQGQENVIIDDLDRAHSCLGHHLKRWADRYSFLAEIKGGAINIRPKNVVVTSNYQIDEIFEDQVLVAALRRRFNIVHMLQPFG